MSAENEAKKIAEMMGGKLESVMDYGNGEGGCVVSFPLPKDHWIYAEHDNDPPMGLRCGRGKSVEVMLTREELERVIEEAARYAIRGATYNGKAMDFDPDALVQNMKIGMVGYFTDDGLSTFDS